MRSRYSTACAVLTGLLAGCGPSETAPVVPRDSVRVALPDAAAAPAASFDPRTTVGPSGNPTGQWTLLADGRTALYGLPGAAALVSVACEGLSAGAPRLIVTRFAPAERGAEAVFAIQGNRRILRLPVRAVALRQHERAWRGSLPAGDERAEVFLGGGEIAATLPGGGRLAMPPLGEARAAIDACRAATGSVLAPAEQSPAEPVETGRRRPGA